MFQAGDNSDGGGSDDDEASPVSPAIDQRTKKPESVAADGDRPNAKIVLLSDRCVFECRLCALTVKHFSRVRHLETSHQITLDAYRKQFGNTEVLRLVKGTVARDFRPSVFFINQSPFP
jgi:hypothetical protein